MTVFPTKKTVNTVIIPQVLYFSLHSCRSHVKSLSPCKPASILCIAKRVHGLLCRKSYKLLKPKTHHLLFSQIIAYVTARSLLSGTATSLPYWRRLREEGFRQEVLSGQICEVSTTLTGLLLQTAYAADNISWRVWTLPCETAPKAVLLDKLVS